MRFRLNISILLIFVLSIAGNSCLKSKKPGIPDSILETLNISSIHKPGYMKMILTFQAPEDSLKLQATYIIIDNLESNYSITHTLVDSLDNEIPIITNNFPDFQSIRRFRDSIEITDGDLHYRTDTICIDFKNLSPDFLINHINKSYKIWRSSVSSDYNFQQYSNYLLPYRVANENIEDYFNFFQKKYGLIVKENLSIKEIALLINDTINSEFNYDIRLEINPGCQSIRKTDSTKAGNLLDLNNYKIKALRSFGVAAVLDYTPYLVDTILGYYSTTVILPDNSKINLLNPDNNKTPYVNNNVAKVYRRSFIEVPNSLFSIKDKSVHTPSFIGNFNYTDISTEYIQTSDTSIIFNDTVDYGYLAIFNDGKLVPIDWTSIDSLGIGKFTQLGTGITYTPVIISNKEIVPIDKAFILGNQN